MNEDKKVGRPELPVELKMVTVTFRALPSQKEKFDALGAGKWIRKQIDKAKLK